MRLPLEHVSISSPTSSLVPGQLRVAVILPCYNEEAAIGAVVTAFRQALPSAEIHVFDNNSSDRTAEVAKENGARVWFVKRKGKGNVVRRMFADVDADIYVMADGDGTYDASRSEYLVSTLVDNDLDMVVGARVEALVDRVEDRLKTYRRGHRFGNRMLTRAVSQIFGGDFRDMLSGYRVFTRRFVKSFPALTTGFEIETELTIHALEIRAPTQEVDTAYGHRPEGSHSKLSTYQDGFKILRLIVLLYLTERPLFSYGAISLFFVALSLAFGTSVTIEFFETGLVPRLPTAVLSASLMLAGFLTAVCAIVLDGIVMSRREMKRLFYLHTGHMR